MCMKALEILKKGQILLRKSFFAISNFITLIFFQVDF